jgi:hypothetical protein
MSEKAIYVSMKTGLPMHNSISSRTSISKSYKNVPFIWAPPVNGYPVLKDMDYEKPVLLITLSNKMGINENEWRIINKATYLFSANNIDFYKITAPALEQIAMDYHAEKLAIFNENKVCQYQDNLYGNDSDAHFLFFQWSAEQTFPVERKKEGKQMNLRKPNNVFCDEIHFQNTDSVEISFWVSDFTKDLGGRSNLYINCVNSDWESTYWSQDGFSNLTTSLYNGWALVRKTLPYHPDYPIIAFDIVNEYSLSKEIFVDFLLIRPLHTDILYESDTFKMINNEIIYVK